MPPGQRYCLKSSQILQCIALRQFCNGQVLEEQLLLVMKVCKTIKLQQLQEAQQVPAVLQR